MYQRTSVSIHAVSASEMTYIVSGGALNSTNSTQLSCITNLHKTNKSYAHHFL